MCAPATVNSGPKFDAWMDTFADALSIIPKTLGQNGRFDVQVVVVSLQVCISFLCVREVVSLNAG